MRAREAVLSVLFGLVGVAIGVGLMHVPAVARVVGPVDGVRCPPAPMVAAGVRCPPAPSPVLGIAENPPPGAAVFELKPGDICVAVFSSPVEP